jgi:transcriptional regulator with XRE-family HTH domain
MNIMSTFSDNVFAALEKRGWTIQQLADACDMDRSNLSKALRGKEGCTLERAKKIADALQVPLSKLVTESRKIVSTAS